MTPPDTRSAKRKGVPLIDGIEKVTGKARYTADLDHKDALVGDVALHRAVQAACADLFNFALGLAL